MAIGTSYRPLPLKQRTSSVDQRRDFSTQTWTSLLGLLKCREYVVTVDHFSIWKRHLAWANENGKDLRDYMTQRYASSMVFMSLLLSAELGVLFNSAGVTTEVRHALQHEKHTTLSFWAGIAIIFSALLTLLSLISIFTAWTMVSSVSEANAHCIFRSSIGQYVAELPGRFIVGSIYSFLVWLIMFFFLLLPPGFWSGTLFLIASGLFVHTIAAFSAFGRVIMHSGAMGSQRVFEPSYEVTLQPHTLHRDLLTKAKANLANQTSIRRQYRSDGKPINRQFSEEELSSHLSERSHSSPPDVASARRRTNSLVKFADGYDTNGDRIRMTPAQKNILIKPDATPPSALSNRASGGLRPPRPQTARRGEGSHTPIAGNTTSMNDNVPVGLVDKWLMSTSSLPDDPPLPPPPPPPHDSPDYSQDNKGLPMYHSDPDSIPAQVSSSRASSALSSLDDAEETNHNLSEEQGSFEIGYGDGYDHEYAYRDEFEEKGIEDEIGWALSSPYIAERKSLLKEDKMEHGDYSSFDQGPAGSQP